MDKCSRENRTVENNEWTKSKNFIIWTSFSERYMIKAKYEINKQNPKVNLTGEKKNENQTKRIILNTRLPHKQHSNPLTLCMSITLKNRQRK